MNSRLYLYKNCKLLKDRNFKIEHGSQYYLSVQGVSESYTSISNFQYIKHSLHLSIKLNKDQVEMEFLSSNNVNYVVITNVLKTGVSAKQIGYFVVNKKWLSEETIQYDLEMDTINSILDDCVLSDRTKILRQHKDRLRIIEANMSVQDISTAPDSSFTLQEATFSYLSYKPYNVAIGSLLPTNSTFLFDISQLQSGLPMSFTATFTYDSLFDPRIDFNAKLLFLDDSYNVIDIIEERTADYFQFRLSLESGFYDYSSDVSKEFPDDAKYVAIVLNQTAKDDSKSHYLAIILSNEPQGEDDKVPLTIADTIFINKKGFFYDLGSRKIARIIDRYSENIQPQLFGSQRLMLNERDNFLKQSFYLVYMNQNSPTDSLVNPVNCFLFGDKKATIRVGGGTYTHTYLAVDLQELLKPLITSAPAEEVIEDWWWAILTPQNNSGMRFEATHIDSLGQGNNIDITFTNADYNGFVAMTWWYGMVYVIAQDSSGTLHIEKFYGEDTIKFTDAIKCVQGKIVGSIEEMSNYPVFPLIPQTGTTNEVYSIKSVDRTDPKIIKIIKLPYCPANVFVDSSGYLVYNPSQWSYDSGKHALMLLDTGGVQAVDCFARLMTFENINPFAYQIVSGTPSKVQLKSDDYESKLGHSDFYSPRVFYDSFAFDFQLELMSEVIDSDNFRVQFNVSGTLNSRFMFTFVDYICSAYETEHLDVRDYNNIMYIARNNECVIFNQQYVNYIRNGYQYDRKAINLRESQMVVSTALSSQSMIKNTVSGFQTGGVAGAIMAFGTESINFAGRLHDMATNVMLAENSQQAKLQQLRNASTGVIDANDVDLLEVYSNNRLSYKIYSVSPKMRKVLFDLFYYTGYIAGFMGLPDTTSRTRFNFVSADVVFTSVPNLPAEIINDVKDKYLAGITFLHKYNGSYDFEQKYENWETSIIDYLGD